MIVVRQHSPQLIQSFAHKNRRVDSMHHRTRLSGTSIGKALIMICPGEESSVKLYSFPARPGSNVCPRLLLIFETSFIHVELRAIILRNVVNSAVWILSGIVVLIVRALTTQGGSILVWEIIGGGMIIFGAGRLVWVLIRTSSTSATPV